MRVESMLNSRIGDNIKKLRKQKGYSLERVSKLADLSLNTIVKIESGINKNPTIETLSKIAKALDVSLDKLLNVKKQT
jgi:transcriptional regulator with XRE-family HTH domain